MNKNGAVQKDWQVVDDTFRANVLALLRKKPYEKMSCAELSSVRYYFMLLIDESSERESAINRGRGRVIEAVSRVMKRKKCN